MNDHCSPESFPCWERYGEHQRSFVSANEIKIAETELNCVMANVPIPPDILDLQPIIDACNTLADLINARWRNMNRDPFTFFPYDPKRSIKANQLLESLGLSTAKRAEPITRRV